MNEKNVYVYDIVWTYFPHERLKCSVLQVRVLGTMQVKKSLCSLRRKLSFNNRREFFLLACEAQNKTRFKEKSEKIK